MPHSTLQSRTLLGWSLPVASIIVAGVHLVLGMLLALAGAPMLLQTMTSDPFPVGLLFFPIVGGLAALSRHPACAAITLLAVAAHATYAAHIATTHPADAHEFLEHFQHSIPFFAITTLQAALHALFLLAVTATAMRGLWSATERSTPRL